jgi:hypothetical protein
MWCPASRARRGSGRNVFRATAGAVLALLLANAAMTAARGLPAPALPVAQGDFAGLVDIGGRRLYLECPP